MVPTQKALQPVLSGLALLIAVADVQANVTYGCQAAATAPKAVQVEAASAQPPNPKQVAFPTDLLPVGKPGDKLKVPMGIKAEVLWDLSGKLYQYNKKIRAEMLRRALSELGHTELEIQPFFLGKHPVTNVQYLEFVKATKHRFPYHWWKDGAGGKFYQAHVEKVRKRAKEEDAKKGGRPDLASLYYWLENWKILDYEIPKGEERVPVVNVSFRDVLTYCGWAGVRPPSEAEWTYAANGGKRKLYLFGKEYSRKELDAFRKNVGLDQPRNCRRLKPVGALGAPAAGPFGHLDMTGQVWEWTMSRYLPQSGERTFDTELKRLRELVAKVKDLPKLPDTPVFKDEKLLAKGGCFFSFSQERWEELRVNIRAPLDDVQTLEALGFRIAKSLRVAYDMSLSRLRFEYQGGQFLTLEKQRPYLRRVDGVERYDLDPTGEIIKAYHAISLTPVNFAFSAKRLSPPEAGKATMQKPVPVAVLITTEKIAKPALDPGIYTVYYRHGGIPQDLKTQLPQAERQFLADQATKDREEREAKKKKRKKPSKKKPKKDPKEEPKKDAKKKDEDKKANEWRTVLKRYGITVKDFQDAKGRIKKGAHKKIKFVYLRQPDDKDGTRTFKLYVKDSLMPHQLLLRDNGGKWITTTHFKQRLSIKTRPVKGHKGVVLGTTKAKKGEVANETVTFDFFTIPFRAEWEKDVNPKKGDGKVMPFSLPLELTTPPQMGAKSWRTNYAAPEPAAGGAAGGNGGK